MYFEWNGRQLEVFNQKSDIMWHILIGSLGKELTKRGLNMEKQKDLLAVYYTTLDGQSHDSGVAWTWKMCWVSGYIVKLDLMRSVNILAVECQRWGSGEGERENVWVKEDTRVFGRAFARVVINGTTGLHKGQAGGRTSVTRFWTW